MLIPGLTSVTLRTRSVAEVVSITVAAGLEAIEWGGDIHVPPLDRRAAAEARQRSLDAGLRVSSYGSYLRLGEPEATADAVAAVLDTAADLGAPMVRVWAGRRSPAKATEADWRRLVDQTWEAASLARSRGLALGFECHEGTFTETRDSTRELQNQVAGSGARFYWQPRPSAPAAEAGAFLETLLPDLGNFHVFHWTRQDPLSPVQRRPLDEGLDLWTEWLAAALELPEDHFALLEFVPGDDADLVAREAVSLRTALDRAARF